MAGPDEANAALLESWELDLRSPIRPRSKPKRSSTIALYLDEARRFATWLAAAGRPASAPGDLEAVEQADVVAWVADLRGQGLAVNTIRSRWVALRTLYAWALEEEIVAADPIAGISVPKGDEPPPDVLPEEAVRALLAACRGSTFNDRRDLALFRFMLATGLRVSEVVGVGMGDLDLLNRIAHVQGKGGRPRVVRFDPATASALDRYRRVRGRHSLARRPELWLGHRGPLTRKGVPTIFDKRAAMAGIGHVHPHQTRHTWAHRSKRAGASSEDLQRLGGWADPSVMSRYGSALAVERALAAYDDFNPMGDL